MLRISVSYSDVILVEFIIGRENPKVLHRVLMKLVTVSRQMRCLTVHLFITISFNFVFLLHTRPFRVVSIFCHESHLW